jgi:hypothetical protein
MEPLLEGALAAKVVAGTWVLREIFSFLLKWRKQDRDDQKPYAPDENWKQYCIERFDDLREQMTQVNTKLEVVKVQLGFLERTLAKLKGARS